VIKLAINGARGRMGQRIYTLAQEDEGFRVVALWEKEGHPDIGKKIGELTINSHRDNIKEADCIIDFSSPLATVDLVNAAERARRCLVVGTTGFDALQFSRIEAAAKHIPILLSPNMSIGVNLLFRLVKEAAGVLSGYKVNIVEAHHVHKKDAPSGTAKKIASLINSGGGEVKNIKSIREDEIVGDHRIIFESDSDKIELLHSAKTRDIFAQGALQAAKWLVNKPAGLYSMDNVLFDA